MDTVVLSFHDGNDDCIEFQAIVNTLDPICAVIDDDDEPEVPNFPGCTVLDSSYGSVGDRNDFVIDYDIEDATTLDPAHLEATLSAFLCNRYHITQLSFGPLPPEPEETGPIHPHGPRP